MKNGKHRSIASKAREFRRLFLRGGKAAREASRADTRAARQAENERLAGLDPAPPRAKAQRQAVVITYVRDCPRFVRAELVKGASYDFAS